MTLNLPRCIHDMYVSTCADCRRPSATTPKAVSGKAPSPDTEAMSGGLPPTALLSPSYARWNSAVANEFFSERSCDLPVYLDIGAETLTRLASAEAIPTADPCRDFIDA